MFLNLRIHAEVPVSRVFGLHKVCIVLVVAS